MVSNKFKKELLLKKKVSSSRVTKPSSKGLQKKQKKRLSKDVANTKILESDKLNWKSVEIPDTLDDFGGLYGVEELDGVGVEYIDGKAHFVVRDSKKDQLLKQEEETEGEADEAGETEEAEEAEDQEDSSNTDEPESIEEVESETHKEDEPKEEQRPKKKQKSAKIAEQDKILEEGLGSGLNFNDVEIPEEVDLPNWSNINLSPYTLQGLSKLGFTNPTPIQKKAIPSSLEGEDIIGKASTGSGKTLAYSIPILEKLVANPDSKTPAGIIFTPTRELAHQVVDHLNTVSKYFPFTQSSIVSLTGGLSIQKQERVLRYKGSGQIIVATPGRFLELIEKNKELADRFSNLDILVLDEADRLLQDGHFDEFEQIVKIFRSVRSKKEKWQTFVFSATFAKDLFSKLANKGYKPNSKEEVDENKEIVELLDSKLNFKSEPIFIDLNPHGKLSNDITETLVECLPVERDLYLYYFLLMYPGTTLVFTNAIDSVKRLVPFLSNLNISAFAIHSNMIQKQRLSSIEKFKETSQKNANSNKSTVLVASDVAARGLDISGIQHVVHYHLPRSADVYIHRSGRTARSGNQGVSVMICSPQEASGPLRNLRKALSNDKAKFRGKATRKWTKDVQRLPIESDIVIQLKDRARIAAELADNEVSTKSLNKEDTWMKQAADDLGVEVDDDSLRNDLLLKKNRTKKENKQLDKNDATKKKRELVYLLKQPVRKDLRRSYLTGGLQNLADSIIRGVGHGTIIGHDKVDALDQLRKNNKKEKK